MLPQEYEDQQAARLREAAWTIDDEEVFVVQRLEAIEQSLASLILGQTAMMETLGLIGAKLAEFENEARPLLARAQQRGRLFGVKPQNPMDRGM
jgi:hypothetical protein